MQMRMCAQLADFRRFQHERMMTIARARAAEDQRRQAGKTGSDEIERIKPLSIALTSPLSPHAAAVAEAFRS